MATVETERRWRTDDKWGSDVTAAGFTVIPNHLLAANQFLSEDRRLTPTELVILFQLLASWWDANRLPFPSKATLARRAGLSPRQVQRALKNLETKGFIRRVTRFAANRARASNAYNLEGLVNFLQQAVREHPKAFRREVPAEK